MNRSDKLKKIGFILLGILLIGVVIYSGFRFLEATVFLDDEKSPSKSPSKTIVVDGVKYFPKQDIETFLIIGVDEDGEMVRRETLENEGMADAIMLAVFNRTDETIDIISLNRDSMTDISVRGLDGRKVDSMNAQLALSYAYGDGMESSCENTIEAVSKMLYGIEIDHFMALNMDAIKVLNDAVDGVTVDVWDDFSAVDPSIYMGRVTLYGDQALTYIRARKDVGDQLNVNRMERQQEYMESFFYALKYYVEMDPEFAVKHYEDLSKYMVTDCSVTTMSSMLERYGAYELGEIVTPEGENVRGEKYMEFYVDEDSLEDLVLEHFFAEKK